MDAMKPVVLPATRDIRLDLFRGLALWFIFLDHVPDNVVSWITVRNYGFSDATEIFVFISGYTAVIAYSRMMLREGWPRAAAKIYRRVWQLYVAHILLFVAFKQREIFLVEPGHQPVQRIGDGHRNQHHVHVHLPPRLRRAVSTATGSHAARRSGETSVLRDVQPIDHLSVGIVHEQKQWDARAVAALERSLVERVQV